MRYALLSTAAAVALFAAACAPGEAPVDLAPTPTPPLDNIAEAPPFDAATLELLFHDGVNAERVANGLAPLAWLESALPLPRAHSADMAERDYFAHVNPEGEDPSARAERLGIDCPEGAGFGENLAMTALYDGILTRTFPDRVETEYDWTSMEEVVASIVKGWMESPGHRANILEPGYVSHAVGVVMTPEFEIYISDNFC
jgi:uncharacterized protein YkwD